MGDRRMISKKIVESARFLKMPLTSQSLYLHLIVNADDDGIVEAYPVISLINANEDDLRILVGKRFVYILNEDLVTYIEDWTTQNKLRADRKADSIYLDLLMEARPDVPILKKKQRSDLKKGEAIIGQAVDGPGTDNGPLNITQSNITKDNLIKDNSIYQSNLDNKNGEDLNEGYRKIIAENIKLDWLLDEANKRGDVEVQMVNEIYETICDVVCNPRENIMIKQQKFSYETVKSRFMKLKYEHIANLLNRIIDSDLKVKNMNAYLISSLYTESLSGTIKHQADLYDDYLKQLRGKPYNV